MLRVSWYYAIASLFAFVHCASTKPKTGIINTHKEHVETRKLSKEDCSLLLDHLIHLSIVQSLARTNEGNSIKADDDEYWLLEEKLRMRTRTRTDAWLRRCVNKEVFEKDFECMRDAIAIRDFEQCERRPRSKKDRSKVKSQ